jgi:hypothetical protein
VNLTHKSSIIFIPTPNFPQTWIALLNGISPFFQIAFQIQKQPHDINPSIGYFTNINYIIDSGGPKIKIVPNILYSAYIKSLPILVWFALKIQNNNIEIRGFWKKNPETALP